MRDKHKKLVDELFRESKPQFLFETFWSSSFSLMSVVWEMTLALHSTESGETKEEFTKLLKEKAVGVFEAEEKIDDITRELRGKFYEQILEPYDKDWYSFYKEMSSFQKDLIGSLTRLFLLKDVLLQIDESHPKRKEIEETLKVSFENLEKIKLLTSELTLETKESSKSVFDAIVITRAIADDASFEEAEKRERKRWE